MKRFLLFILLLSVSPLLRATHNIAGEITMRCIGGNQYEVTVTTYTNTQSPADRCELSIEWGDNTTSIAPRVNGPMLGPCASSNEHDGDTPTMLAAGYAFTRQNIYVATHTYPGAGTYDVNVKDPNRVASILNIPNSVNVPFYLHTTIVVNPLIGCNSTPTLTTYPLDKACMGHCFYHNPGAIDPDGDSLSYDIGNCLDTNGQVIAGYIPLSSYGGVNIDHVTGDLSWCSPTIAGKYNLIIAVTEWKQMPNGTRINIGTVYRDMSIEVINHCDNNNPNIPDLPDLCVTAGDTVAFGFDVTDLDMDEVQMDGYGATFGLNPASILTPSGSMIQTIYRDSFNWRTNCDNVRLQPWAVTFKARDNGSPVSLLDIETINITVVSPGPATLSAAASGSSITLNWSVNPCDPAPNFCKGYKIYRHQGPTGWVHGPCETGVPAYTGFVLIGTVTGLNNTTFVDDNGGAGLIPGVDYCYRVCAYFHDNAESYSSPEACTELLRDVPVLTNVDVMSTGSNDQIWVGWANPLANGVDFDTIAHPGPYTIVVERCDAMNFNVTNSIIVQTITANSFYQIPTHYIDNGLNTATGQYSYRLTFSDATTQIGHCQPASSVFLTATPSDNQVGLSWVYNVPWTNYAAAIYRFNSTTSLWDSLTTANGNSYIDDSLLNGRQYCYYITTHGSYFNATLPPELYNRSQQVCATPIDLTPPCPPVLVVNSDCFNSINDLIWTDPDNMNCGTDDVVQYHVYYSPTDSGSFTLLSVLSPNDDTTITYSNLFSVAGCYAITAIDTFGNESAYSNVVCIDNCPDYELPNVFTPNGDGTNDWFIPFPYKYIQDVDIHIYDRWGTLVFETKDPALKWDGRDMTTHKLCTDGVYYYTAIVNEIHLSGIQPRELKGFVHLFGKDIGQFH